MKKHNGNQPGTHKPEVTIRGFLDMQVCVPGHWNDKQIRDFAERENPCGTTAGWFIRKEGNERLSGAPERASCVERLGYVHVMLEA